MNIFRTCTSDETYSRYDCVEEYVNRKIKDEVSCILSMQAHNEPNTNKTICSNMTLFYSKVFLIFTQLSKSTFYLFYITKTQRGHSMILHTKACQQSLGVSHPVRNGLITLSSKATAEKVHMYKANTVYRFIDL